MSIMCCIYVPEGIVMAADSRLTRTKRNEPVELPPTNGNQKTLLPQTIYTLSDNAQKVLLIKKVGVGVSFCGDAIINGATVADFIRRFEIEKVISTDTTQGVADKLAQYYTGIGTHFFVGGYDADVPYVFDVIDRRVIRINIVNNCVPTPIPKDAADDGQPVSPDTGAPENIINSPSPLVQDSSEPAIEFGALWAGQKTAITKVVNDEPPLNADWGTMPLKDAIDFAEFLIDTTIKYERFCNDIQTCGGDVDILVITKDEAFWKQHKIYNPIRN